jgi:hypothetical protein
MSTIATKWIPEKPGNYIHLGYQPLDDSEAFALVHHDKFRNPWSSNSNTFYIPKDATTGTRLANLCHQFVCLNPGIDILVPKDESLNETVKRRIYQCTLTYTTRCKEYTKLQISIHASQQIIEGELTDQFLLSLHRICGDAFVHYELFKHFKQYIESDGKSDPILVECREDEDEDDVSKL